MVVRPLRLPDTTSRAGYDHIDPLTQWFLGGSGTAGAEATGISDDDRYGLELLNVGSGGKSLKATSGNGSHQLRVDNTAAAVVGGLSVSGASVFSSPVTMLSTLAVTGAAAFSTGVTVGGPLGVTGLATFSIGVTVGGPLGVTGLATFSTGVTVGGPLDVTGAATFRAAVTMLSTLAVTGTATFSTGVNVGGALSVTGVADFRTNVTIQQGLTVSQSSNFVGNVAVGGQLTVTGVADFRTNVTIQQGLTVSQSMTVAGNLLMSATSSTITANNVAASGDVTIDGGLTAGNSSGDAHSFNGTVSMNQVLTLGAIPKLNSSTGAGATFTTASGAFRIADASGTTMFVPYKTTWP